MPWPSEQVPEPEAPRFEGELTFDELPTFIQKDILRLRELAATIPALKPFPVWK